MKPFSFAVAQALGSTYDWIQRRFTTPAKWVLGFALAASIAARDQTENSAKLSASILCSALLISLLSAPFLRVRLTARRRLPARVSLNEPLTYSIVVTNPSTRSWAGLELLEGLPTTVLGNSSFPKASHNNWVTRLWSLSTRSSFTASLRCPNPKVIPLPPLPGDSTLEVQSTLCFQRRGIYTFHDLIITRPDPLGLVRGCVGVTQKDSIIALPKRCRIVTPHRIRRPDRNDQNRHNPRSEVLGGDFAGLRDYRPGDPLKFIHWRSWARGGRALLKQFDQPVRNGCAIILDVTGKLTSADIFEGAVRLGASLVETLFQKGICPELISLDSEGRGVQTQTSTELGLRRTLETLAQICPLPQTTLSALSSVTFHHTNTIRHAAVVFSTWDAARLEFLKQLLHRRILAHAYVIDDGAQRSQSGMSANAVQDSIPVQWIPLTQLEAEIEFPWHVTRGIRV